RNERVRTGLRSPGRHATRCTACDVPQELRAATRIRWRRLGPWPASAANTTPPPPARSERLRTLGRSGAGEGRTSGVSAAHHLHFSPWTSLLQRGLTVRAVTINRLLALA